MLYFFYKLILIISRTINVNIHLEFRLFNVFFNYFNIVKKNYTRQCVFFKNTYY